LESLEGRQRDGRLYDLGYRVIRIWNNDLRRAASAGSKTLPASCAPIDAPPAPLLRASRRGGKRAGGVAVGQTITKHNGIPHPKARYPAEIEKRR